MKKPIHFRLDLKIYEDMMDIVMKKNMNITEFITTSIVHELYGKSDKELAIYELNEVRKALTEKISLLSDENIATHEATQNVAQPVTQQDIVLHEATQNTDELPDKTVDVSTMPIENMTTLPWAIRYVQDKTYFKPFVSGDMLETLANQCGMSAKAFRMELMNAGVNFTITE